jgi:hypothetical protein
MVPENRSRTALIPRNFRRRRDLFCEMESFKADSMNTDISNGARFSQKARSPAAYAMAVAVLGLLSMLLVDHGPWNRPHVQTAEAHYATTGAAARAAGATVTPTMPKSEIEPVVPGPKPVEPPNPVRP